MKKVIFPTHVFPLVKQVFELVREQNLKGNVKYGLTRILRAMDKEWESFNDQRMIVLAKYAERDERGNLSLDPVKEPDKMIEYEKEYFATFGDSEITVDIPPIKPDWLDDMKLSGQQMDVLMFFIDDDTPVIKIVDN